MTKPLAGLAIGLLAALAACTLTVDTDGLSGPSLTPAPSIDGGAVDAGVDADTPETSSAPDAGADSSLPSCPESGCVPSVLVRELVNPLGVGVGGAKLYVGHEGGLVELDLDGTNRKTVVSGMAVNYLFVSDTDVFFSEQTSNAIRRWPRSGGPSVVLVSAPDLQGVALSPTALYYARYTDIAVGGGVYRVAYPALGEPKKVLAYDHPEGIFWSNGRLYVGSDFTNSAISVADDGTDAPIVLVTGGGPVGVTLFGPDVFIARQGGGDILRVDLEGGTPTFLVRDQLFPSGVAATERAIYWTENKGGRVGVLVR